MTVQSPYDAMFSGVIGQHYDLLKLICPLSIEMSRLVGLSVSKYCQLSPKTTVVEVGGGTGITTLAMLSEINTAAFIISIDNEPVMQNQAKQNLANWSKQLQFICEDALTALKNLPNNSTDVVASAYTLHNFEHKYRRQVIDEIFRVLKPGGLFVNGDRYGLDEIDQHTLLVQNEIANYFKALAPLNKIDVMEQWIIHLFNDESENHVMRETPALNELHSLGFNNIQLCHRQEVNALVTAYKPST